MEATSQPGAASEAAAPFGPVPEAVEKRASPIELLWDLVFVFAITQVTSLLSRNLSWAGFGRSMLVLALVWWAWSAFVWAANAADADSEVLRAVLLSALVLVFIVGLALPRAYRDGAPLFACAYAGVRLLHLALYADASRRGNASWRVIAGFATTVGLGAGLLVIGSFLGEPGRIVLWTLAAVIDYAGPGVLTRKRLRGLQDVAVTHFAERYGLFIIICLGESLVTAGLAASGRHASAGLVLVVVLGLLITVGLWWIYFDSSAPASERRLREHHDPVLAASDAYSYLHLLLVAGIIIFVAGIKVTIYHYGQPLPAGPRLALCGGVALYLAGHVAFRLRLGQHAQLRATAAIGAILALFALGTSLGAWVVAAILMAILALLCGSDARPGGSSGESHGGTEEGGGLRWPRR
jgi:low temperature requirement protein LtrA